LLNKTISVIIRISIKEDLAMGLRDRLRVNPNARAYVSYFGRGILLVVGVLVIAGVVIGTFMYGSKKRDEVKPEQQTAQEQPQPTDNQDGAQPNQSNPGSSQPTQPGTQPQDSPGSTPAPTQPSENRNNNQPVAGPEQLSNTGPREWAVGLVVASLGVASFAYVRSRQALGRALRQIG
jgi:hypothetical protein